MSVHLHVQDKVVYDVILFHACYGEKNQNHVLDIMYLVVEFFGSGIRVQTSLCKQVGG